MSQVAGEIGIGAAARAAERQSEPSSATNVGVSSAENIAAEVRGFLIERANWFKYEYLHGGSLEHLHAREVECRYLADKSAKMIVHYGAAS